MSTLTIRKTWNVNGAAADAESVVLRDPTGAYGIRRNDTGAVIVLAGTPMSHAATGAYEYTAEGVDAGTTYTAWVEVVYDGETYRFEITAVAGIDAANVSYPDGLRTILNQLTSLYAQVTLRPKPSYNVEGNIYRWREYQQMLGSQIEQLTKLIAQANPFEIVSGGIGD